MFFIWRCLKYLYREVLTVLFTGRCLQHSLQGGAYSALYREVLKVLGLG